MENPRKPISFIATDNPDKARVFFSDVLELELLESSPFALVFADGEHVLRVQIVPKVVPAAYTAHGWEVAELETEAKRLIARDVQFLRFDKLLQDDLGIWTSPDGHKIAWFNDPSDNVLSFTQYAAN